MESLEELKAIANHKFTDEELEKDFLKSEEYQNNQVKVTVEDLDSTTRSVISAIAKVLVKLHASAGSNISDLTAFAFKQKDSEALKRRILRTLVQKAEDPASEITPEHAVSVMHTILDGLEETEEHAAKATLVTEAMAKWTKQLNQANKELCLAVAGEEPPKEAYESVENMEKFITSKVFGE